MDLETIESLKPKKKIKIIDLVSMAGVDTRDWYNGKGGESKASSNPKYCFEWSFVQPTKVVVLNIWHHEIKLENGSLLCKLDLRREAKINDSKIWKRRSLKMDKAIQTAFKDGLTIRVIFLDGKSRDRTDSDADPSIVTARLLDNTPWIVSSYDWESGECTLLRGGFADQFMTDNASVGTDQPKKKTSSKTVYERSPIVRENVLLRANGFCEWCNCPGFVTKSGTQYLETHHITPLSEGGADKESNVAGLCPNHHMQAHYGINSIEMKEFLLDIAKES